LEINQDNLQTVTAKAVARIVSISLNFLLNLNINSRYILTYLLQTDDRPCDLLGRTV